MGRAPCCEKIGIKKGRWTAEEDKILSDYILSNGEGSWRSLPKNAGLKRCGKSCRLRWINYLRSDLKRGNITPEEEDLIVKLHSTMGNRWSIIASNLPGRTDNEIKNYWNSHLSRKLHSYFRKSTVENNALMPPKRRLGRTSRSAMKPKLILNPKTHVKNTPKKVKNDVVLPVATKENGEGRQEEALMVLSSSNLSGPSDNGDEHGGSCKQGINGDDNGVLCFNDDIFDACFLLDEPHAVHVSSSDDQSNNLEDSGVKRGFESSNDVVVTDQMVVDDFVDWDFVWREGEDLWNGKESLDSMSWEEIESEIRQSESNGFEPLDPLDDENAMVGWLLS